MGASGIYAMVTVMQPEMVPSEKWGTYVGITSIVFVLSSVLGPMLGGAINGHDNNSWRWVFLLNAPAGAIATALIAFVMPAHFPHQTSSSSPVRARLRDKFTLHSFARLDILGALLLLAASILLVFGFEEAGARYSWNSAAVLSTLVIGAVLFAAFVGWESVIAGDKYIQEPVFPLRLMKDRRFIGMSL